MRKTDGCKLFGAYQALAGLQDCMILFHSVVGCHFGTLAFHLNHCPVNIHQATTLMSDHEVIFGGVEAVRRALDAILERSNVKTVFIITGCVSELIGDDLESLRLEYKEHLNLIVIRAPGFEGGIQKGFEDALSALTAFLPPPQEAADARKRTSGKVNVLGLGADDYCARGDWNQLCRLLDGYAKLNPCPPFCSVEDIWRMADADVTIVFGRGVGLAQYLKKHYGIPYEILPYPYGFLGMEDLWEVLERHLGCNCEDRQKQAEEMLNRELKLVYPYLQSLYYANAAVYAEESRLKGMVRFLEEELGMRCVLAKPSGDVLERRELEASHAVLMAASSHERKITKDLNIPLIRIGYPVLDRVCGSTDTMIGAEGTVTLVKEIINQTLELWSGKDGALL